MKRMPAQELLRELDSAMKSPRGDYYQGDIADPHRSLHIVERHLSAAIAQAVKERDAEWADYVDWLNGYAAADAQIASLHGFTCNADVVAEGKRRRAALGYVPKGEIPKEVAHG